MNRLEKQQVKQALSLQAFLLVFTGFVLLSTFFLPYAIAQGDHADEIAGFNEMVGAYEQLLIACGQPAPSGLQSLKSVDWNRISMFNCAKIFLFIWDSTKADDVLDTTSKVLTLLILCLPLLNVIIPVAIILNALWRKPFWVLFYTAIAYGDFMWQRSYLVVDDLISSEMYRPGIVLWLFPCACIVSAVLALWMWGKKITIKRKIKAAHTISS